MGTLDTSFIELQKTRTGGLVVCVACGKMQMASWDRTDEPLRCQRCCSFTRLAPNYEEQDRKKAQPVKEVRKRRFVIRSGGDDAA